MALTDKELLKLAPGQLFPILFEELGETIQALGKLARHGPVGTDDEGNVYNNLEDVIREFEQVNAIMGIFVYKHDLVFDNVIMEASNKRNSV